MKKIFIYTIVSLLIVNLLVFVIGSFFIQNNLDKIPNAFLFENKDGVGISYNDAINIQNNNITLDKKCEVISNTNQKITQILIYNNIHNNFKFDKEALMFANDFYKTDLQGNIYNLSDIKSAINQISIIAGLIIVIILLTVSLLILINSNKKHLFNISASFLIFILLFILFIIMLKQVNIPNQFLPYDNIFDFKHYSNLFNSLKQISLSSDWLSICFKTLNNLIIFSVVNIISIIILNLVLLFINQKFSK